MRIQLKAGLRRCWRGPGCLQIGVGSGHGTLLTGVTDQDAAMLERLAQGVELRPDAHPRQRRLAQLLSEAGLLVTSRTGRAALAQLGSRRHRLAADAAVWALVHADAGDGWGLIAARARRHVAVVGAGRAGSTLAGLLAAAGVGRVVVHDPRPVGQADLMPGGHAGADIGAPREEAATRAVERIAEPAANPPAEPDLTVLVRHAAADAAGAEPLVRADRAHLSVVLRGRDALVGPLVVPGRGACLRCLDLHRTDRDPLWPTVLAQLLYPVEPVEEPEECAGATLVAGLAGLQVLSWLDGLAHPAALGATLEVELPDGLVARRPWSAHPACGCHWPPEPVSSARDRPRGPTMSR